MTTIPESWTDCMNEEFDRYVAELFQRDGTRYRSGIIVWTISERELATIRDEVIANATADSTSLAYQMLMRCPMHVEANDECPTCDVALRLAWGASATRRLLQLPASQAPPR